MRVKITFIKKIFEKLKAALNWDGREKAAWVLCHDSKADGGLKLIPYEVIVPDESDYVSRSAGHYELKKEFITKGMGRAVAEQAHIIQCHIHPKGILRFSAVDDHHELMLMQHLNEKIEGMHHASIVFSNSGEELDSWIYDAQNDRLSPVEKVVVVGKDKLDVHIPTGAESEGSKAGEDLDRTVMALGAPTVEKLGRLDFGVIGASGLGGTMIDFLARDRIRSISICDKDTIDESNLNRMPWATATDIGRKKTEFNAEVVRKISPGTRVSTFTDSFYEPNVQTAFSQVDLIFGCLDSGARLSVNRLACANLVPYFDLGAGFEVIDGKPTFIGGQVFSVIPSSSICLSCSGAFDMFRADYIPEKDRQREIRQGYVQGNNGTVPLIMSLDSVIAGLGYRHMLKYIAGDGVPFRIHYNDLESRVFASECQDDGCMTCSVDGFVGKGDKVPLMVPRKKSVTPPASKHKNKDMKGGQFWRMQGRK